PQPGPDVDAGSRQHVGRLDLRDCFGVRRASPLWMVFGLFFFLVRAASAPAKKREPKHPKRRCSPHSKVAPSIAAGFPSTRAPLSAITTPPTAPGAPAPAGHPAPRRRTREPHR